MKFRVEQIHGFDCCVGIASVKLIGTLKLLWISCQLLPESNQFWMEPNLTARYSDCVRLTPVSRKVSEPSA